MGQTQDKTKSPRRSVECESCSGGGTIREPDKTTRECLDCSGTGVVVVDAEFPRGLRVEEIHPGAKVIRMTAEHDDWRDIDIEVSRDDRDVLMAEACAYRLADCWNAMAGIANPSEYRERAERWRILAERHYPDLKPSGHCSVHHPKGECPASCTTCFPDWRALTAAHCDLKLKAWSDNATLTSERDAAIRERDELREAANLANSLHYISGANEANAEIYSDLIDDVRAGRCEDMDSVGLLMKQMLVTYKDAITLRDALRAALSQSQQGGEKKPEGGAIQ